MQPIFLYKNRNHAFYDDGDEAVVVYRDNMRGVSTPPGSECDN